VEWFTLTTPVHFLLDRAADAYAGRRYAEAHVLYLAAFDMMHALGEGVPTGMQGLHYNIALTAAGNGADRAYNRLLEGEGEGERRD
jgi:hypothetical protein